MTSTEHPSSLLRLLPRRGLWLGLLCAGLALPPLATSQPLGARGEDFLYQIEAGDTLEQLAHRYTLQPSNWTVLQRLNQVDDTHALRIGSVLRIPFALIPERPADTSIIHVKGTVTLDDRPLRPGEALADGQILRSGGSGTATIQLEDRSLLTLAPGTELRIGHLRAFQGAGLTDTILEIRQGSIETIVAPGNTGVGRFEVRTPATVTGVRGTRLRVHADTDGSRHEILHGRAAVSSDAGQAEQRIDANQGMVYDTSGTFRGIRPLLSAPQLPAAQDVGTDGTLDFPALPGAVAYRVRVSQDAEGALLAHSQRFAAPPVRLPALGGLYHVFVRGIDDLGIEGRDATVALRLQGGLTSADGLPVLTTDGTPVTLQSF
ncbi:FecR domain-containing protein [Castellaniella sp. GW247-6E4]|uniref:FecR family protein n=1 Tax=Castellaniella sp. GW247-6E4 TaxID=3140380 RepID=UPI0033159061